MKKILLFLLFLNLVHVDAYSFENTGVNQDVTISSFETDGCSSFPDGIPNFNGVDEWLHCCIIHDIDYWRGGSELEKESADIRLGACVDDANESENTHYSLGNYMYSGVRVGGLPRFSRFQSPFSFRWGYGWEKKNSSFDQLSVENKKSVLVELTSLKNKLRYGLGINTWGLTNKQNNLIIEKVNSTILSLDQEFQELSNNFKKINLFLLR